jgi:hypothetical protein
MVEYVDELSVPHTLAAIEGQQAVWLAAPTCIRHEVVGETYNPEQMRRIVASIQGRLDAVLPAWLMPEPTNPHDRNAVIVWILGGKVGYLPSDLAARWQPILGRLCTRYGFQVACRATLEPPSAASRGEFGVLIWLPGLPALCLTPPHQPQALHQPIPAAQPVPGPPPPAIPAQPAVTAAATPAAPAVVQNIVAAPPKPPPTPEELEKLRADIAQAKKELAAARKELTSVEEALEIQSFGFYQPRYGFESSAQYVVRLKATRDEQQALIKTGKAAPCDTTWKVGGSAAEGKKMVKQQAKLMLRAFNGECDAAIAKVKYDNVVTLEERITKAYEAINKLGEVQRVFIGRQYFDLKLAELRLVHEHREKVQQEKDEQRRIKEQMREEQKAQDEIDRAKAEAEQEEAAKAAALAKAQAELAAEAASGKQHEKLEALVTRLETELHDALDRKAKAIARAQLTKSGHVYVLSNIGSFGEGIYKIGMTRRLEPLERVAELGDASVPFPFDVHAIIYSEDAPELENKLHQAFASRRINVVNMRKEYFRVTLDEIRDVVEKAHGLVTFLLVPQAEEYRKTCAAKEAPPDAPPVQEAE